MKKINRRTYGDCKVKHEELKIIYEHGLPYGIRDRSGFLIILHQPNKYSGQEERYREDVRETYSLADYLLAALKNRDAAGIGRE